MRYGHTITAILMMGFLLSISDGKIALWTDGKAEPTVFPYHADLLPEPDQKRLMDGIRIEDEAELSRLLEDYLS